MHKNGIIRKEGECGTRAVAVGKESVRRTVKTVKKTRISADVVKKRGGNSVEVVEVIFRQDAPDIRRKKTDVKLMERAGVSSRSARTMSWYENERDAYQHHADYLKRLSKLREELIQQEQNNLANALDRLKMRSYGREYVYSRPGQEKKLRNRHSANLDTVNQRKSLLTTFEQFQRLRPKKKPPLIMPLEGKSLIDTPAPLTDRQERHERQERNERQPSERDTTASSSVDESVRANLQRLGGQTIPSIPRQRRAQHKDIFVESSSYRKTSNNDSNNASSSEDRVTKMQKLNQKMMRMRHEAREADRAKLAPDSFRLTINDEDKMNLEQLEKYYCVYYIPAPASSPATEDEPSVQLPSISSNGSHVTNGDKNGRGQKNGKIGYKVATDVPVPPSVCNCACRMYVSGNKVETGMDQLEYSIQKMQTANDPGFVEGRRKNGYTNHKTSSRGTDKTIDHNHNTSDNGYKGPPDSAERKKIRIDMPSIVYNTVHTPEPPITAEPNSGLTKAFKQKELRQKELSNLMEDVRELNKITDDLAGSTSNE